ncbi:MAG TPA: rhomboid family intramembrane serine protease [Kofleriaceae bacterium]|nr:rhomboid family intramembrane serine protease [Kofleriaceae bacterium]
MAKLRITYNAPVVLTFTLAAVVVFIITRLATPLQSWFTASPSLDSIHSYVGLFTHILGHENWPHLFGNFMLILLIGPILEERHGSGPLLIMILLTALITGVANALLSSAGLMGASGIVFMMILLASMANMKSREIPLTFIAVAIIYLGGELVRSFRNDNISQLAHLVGGAAGAAFGFFIAGKRAKADAKDGKDAKELKPVAPDLGLKGLKAK